MLLTKFICAAVLLVAVATPETLRAQDQQSPETPYASIDSKIINYAGPGREASYDLNGPTTRIGLLAPLKGPRRAEGEEIVSAARLALADASRNPLPNGRRLELVIGDESGPSWGSIADEIIRLVVDQKVVAIVTSASGAVAHLSEQVGNRIGVPVLTLASDDTTTEINLPWIFRLGPSDALQAQIIAQDIYNRRGLRRVLLVAENNHDGRVGGQQFQEAARQFTATKPTLLALDPQHTDVDSLGAAIGTEPPQAIVLWTQPEITRALVQKIWAAGIRVPVFLSQDAGQQGLQQSLRSSDLAAAGNHTAVEIWTVASGEAESALRNRFELQYQHSVGKLPGPVAAEAYDAVRILEQAVRQAGPNRARVRDQLAEIQNLPAASGTISFDAAGSNRTSVQLVRLP